MFSPVKSGRSCLASAEVYFCFAERVVRSFAVRPPELYGGSVMTESTQSSGRPARTLRASPWCREKGKEGPQFGCGMRGGNYPPRAGVLAGRKWACRSPGPQTEEGEGESKNCRGESADDQEVRR